MIGIFSYLVFFLILSLIFGIAVLGLSFSVANPTITAPIAEVIIAPINPTTNGNSNPPNTASRAGPVSMAIV